MTILGCRRSGPFLLAIVATVAASGVAEGQPVGPPPVADGAKLFSEGTTLRAAAEISRIEKEHGVAIAVETVESLRGQGIDEFAVRRAERLGHKGIFVLIAKDEHKAEVLASPRALREALGRDRLNQIRDAMLRQFKNAKMDEGLMDGIRAAEAAIVAVRPGFLPESTAKPTPTATATPGGSSAGTSSLVIRQQVRLSLSGARKAIEGAEAKAAKEGWKMNIAVVDDGGHLLAFERMDGARPASVATATTKAVTAATMRQASGPLPNGNQPPDPLTNVGLQNASGGRITTLLGGVPIVVDDQVIGAVGVGGGSGEQDLETAKAGVAAFLDGLKAADPAKPKEGSQPATPAATPEGPEPPK